MKLSRTLSCRSPIPISTKGRPADTPKCNGVNDPRMGPSTPSSQSQIICPTDEQTFDNCPGYFGHIPLSKPVFWPQYISGAGGGGIVKTVLKFICYKCSKLLIDFDKPTEKTNFDNSQRRKGRNRYDSFKNLNPKKNCGSCQAPQPKYCVEQNTKLVAEFRQDNDKAPRRVQFTAELVKSIFSRMTDESIVAMGFDPKLSRPEWMICSVFPNPPPAIRPSSLRIDTSQRAEDDLTVKLLEIVKYNKELAKKLKSEVRADNIDAYIQLLQVHIASYVNNDVNNGYKVMRKSGAAFKSLVTRFKGKTGRIRGNLMGKRANFSARSVITGDPSISVGEVGVPYKIAMVLTYPDIVTPLNKEKLTALVRNGPNKYPGARSIRRRGRPIHILQKLLPLDQLNQLDTIELEFGDIVNRHLMDGDFVLFNRQPSLHRMSMMSHRVRVLNGHTFRLQLAVVNPYNADFDGDEMNLSVPQNVESVMELENLCRVPLQIVSPQHNAPVMGINQDALVGAFLLTNDEVRLTRRHMMQLQLQNSNFDGSLPKPQGKNGLYTGKQALSLILQDFSMRYAGKPVPIVIKNGELISGQLGKKQLGEVTNSITHVVFNDFGPDEALRFLDNEQQVVNNYLLYNSGFSVGMSDCLLPMDVREEIRETIVTKLAEAAKFLRDAHENDMKRKSWYSTQQTDFEDQITDLLKKIREDTKGDQKITDVGNRFLAMMASGSKGKPENLIQIMSCLGQQVVSVKQAESSTFKSQRIPYNVGKIKGGYDGRTLPHFHRHDDGAAARGFCENSFLTGLNPHEFFFHNASGREGLIDTAIKTADTGYLQRRLVKLMEDEKVYYDGTVRTNSRLIIQYAYGCDGIEPTKLEKDNACQELYSADDTFLRQNCKMAVNDDWTLIVDAKIRAAIKKDKDLEVLLEDEFMEIYEGRRLLREEIFKYPVSPMSLAAKTENAVGTQMPINLKRLIVNAKDRFKLRKKLSDMSPRYVVEQVSELLESLLKLTEGATLYQRKAAIDGMLLPRILIRYHLACKRVLTDYRFTKDMFDYVILQIKHRYFTSMAQAGDMVGIIAAQSLGQPTTQMVLNSVEYDTELLLKVDGKLERVKIGEYIDKKLERLPEERIERHPQDTLLGWTKDKDIEVLSCDEVGKIDWQKVEAVTRHPVVNEDGSNTLLKVTLHSGRQVVATKGKSFLTRQDNKIKPSLGKDLKIGDYLPVSKVLRIPYRIDYLDMRDYLPPTEWLYMSEVEKALEWKKTHKKHWWKGDRHTGGYGGLGIRFDLPYTRSDTFVEAFLGGPNFEPYRAKKCWSDCVYPRIATLQTAHIPEKVPLDEEFGFLCGAYLAEGNCTYHHMMISNLDDDFNDRIDKSFKRWGVNYHIIDEARPKGWTKSLRSHSLVLTQLFLKLFGTGSHLKRIAPELLAAPDVFLKGLIGGYFDGDGCLTNKNLITAYSASHGMLEDIQQILVRFGIKSSVRQMSVEAWEQSLLRQPKARRGWTLTINAAETTIFQKSFEMTIRTKQRDLDGFNSTLEYGLLDVIPNVITTTWGDANIKRSDLKYFIENTEDRADLQILQSVSDEEIIYDRVIRIEEVSNEKRWVYDLTVDRTRNFNLANGLCGRDTFHSSGIQQQFNVVDGVPRLEELISASKKPKAPTVTIYLKDQFANDEGRAQMVLNKLRSTAMKDIAKSSEIVYDPNDSATLMSEDTEFLKSYYTFMREEECDFDSPWVLRLELDKEKMLERQIRMWEIEQKLLERFEDELHCVLADDNAKHLIARIRVRNDADDPSSDQDTIFLLKQVERHIMEETFRGIEGVQSAMLPPRDNRPFVQKVSETGALTTSENDREIVIVAQQIPGAPGESLLSIFKLPEVDTYRTTSNYVGDVYKYLGIEAARNVLLREILKVYSSDYINHRHVEMLVDTMTCKGDLIAITRTGIVKLGVGPLARSSFEETETQFINAAVFAEVDAFKGVSANCMVGQPVPGGTGECKVLLDETLLPQLAPITEEAEEEEDAEIEAEQRDMETAKTFDIGRIDDFKMEDDIETPFEL